MEKYLNKALKWYPLSVYILLAIWSEFLVYYCYNNTFFMNASAAGVIYAYISAPILAVTYGAIIFRATILGIKWILMNSSEFCLISIYFISLLPFMSVTHSVDYYIGLGALTGFISVVLLFFVDKGDVASRTYQFLAFIILLLSLLFMMIWNKHKGTYLEYELSLSTYFGGILGIMFGGIAFGEIMKLDNKKHGK